VIKSGGEWISSVALENAIMAMPAVAEAAVVGIAHPRWDERPLALVMLREGCSCTLDAIREHLAPHFPKWWLPDGAEFVSAIPKTSVGKFQKREIRDRYRDYFAHCVDSAAPAGGLDQPVAAAQSS
jgi:fatty-acyl-CoA synthase